VRVLIVEDEAARRTPGASARTRPRQEPVSAWRSWGTSPSSTAERSLCREVAWADSARDSGSPQPDLSPRGV